MIGRSKRAHEDHGARTDLTVDNNDSRKYKRGHNDDTPTTKEKLALRLSATQILGAGYARIGVLRRTSQQTGLHQPPLSPAHCHFNHERTNDLTDIAGAVVSVVRLEEDRRRSRCLQDNLRFVPSVGSTRIMMGVFRFLLVCVCVCVCVRIDLRSCVKMVVVSSFRSFVWLLWRDVVCRPFSFPFRQTPQ